MPDHKAPGIFIKQVSLLSPSISSVETAIPAFTGYTQKARLRTDSDLILKPMRILSLAEYEHYFGYPQPENGSISVVFSRTVSGMTVLGKIDERLRSKYLMHYSLQLYFANGGGPCWITSVGDYSGNTIVPHELKEGLKKVARKSEVTLLLFPDAINLSSAFDYYDVHTTAIAQAVRLKDRFVVMDVYHDAANGSNWKLDIDGAGGSGGLRNYLSGTAHELRYAAAYFPGIFTGIDFNYKTPGDDASYKENLIKIKGADATNLATLKQKNNTEYMQAMNAVSDIQMLLPASPAIAGIYVKVDKERGVWKAPANINIAGAIAPEYVLNDVEQQNLNVDVVAGKSINVIRSFAGRGVAIVWGARTLGGNDNEWRYISVRRYCLMAEKSIRIALRQFSFEPNDQSLWHRVSTLIQNYLNEQWKAGALQGNTTRDAFFVNVGLGKTMTLTDILNGRMILEVGVAMIRPAEFIILKFVQKMIKKT